MAKLSGLAFFLLYQNPFPGLEKGFEGSAFEGMGLSSV
jgi:hypothetical protein